MSRRRTGKIARLPKNLRDVVNTMLRDGATNAQIRGKAGEDINDQNIAAWRDGGYIDWLQEQERLDDMRARREFALQIVKENEGSRIHEATLQIAANQCYEVLTNFDADTLTEKLREDPSNFPRLVNAIAKLSDGGLKFERYKQEVAEKKAAIERELEGTKGGGVTPETLKRIEGLVKML